jgi:hypothetical protein
MSSSRCAIGVLSILLFFSAGRARADESIQPPDRALLPARAQRTLDEREASARLWQYGWGALGYGMAVSFGAVAATTNRDSARIAFGFAAGGIFIDTSVHMLASIEPNASVRAREQPGQVMNQLRLAAEAEELRQSLVFGHLFPAGAATVGGLVLWLGFGNMAGAIAATTAAVVTNELRILTQPTAAMKAWQALGRGQGHAEGSHGRGGPAWSWSLLFTGAGGAVRGTF